MYPRDLSIERDRARARGEAEERDGWLAGWANDGGRRGGPRARQNEKVYEIVTVSV